MTPEERWGRVRGIAADAYRDGIDMLACVEILERGNREETFVPIRDAGGGLAMNRIRDALFWRILFLAMRAYAPVRKGDKQLRAAFELLRDPEVSRLAYEENRADLDRAVDLWKLAETDERNASLSHYRNKAAAHWSELDDGRELPQINDLFGFARSTATIAEKLAAGTGVVMIDIDHQVEAFRESADALWSRWA